MSNLLPIEQKKSILRLYRKRFLALTFFYIIALALVGLLLLLPSLFLSKSSESLLSQKRDVLASNDTSTITKSLAASIGDINTRLAIFPGNTTASPLVADFVNPVLGAKTKAIHLTNLTYALGDSPTTAAIQIEGTADSREDLLSFTGSLKAIKTFSNVNVPITSFIKDSDVTFTITAAAALK